MTIDSRHRAAFVLMTDAEENDMGSDALDALKQRALHEAERIAEALVFASSEPVAEKLISGRLPDDTSVRVVMERLAERYAARGINLVRVGDA